MYKLSYYRTWEIMTAMGQPMGFDTVRNVNPGYKNFKLNYFTEAFTSDKWIIRIYKRNPRGNREAVELLKEGEYKKYTSDTISETLKSTFKYATKDRTIKEKKTAGEQ